MAQQTVAIFKMYDVSTLFTINIQGELSLRKINKCLKKITGNSCTIQQHNLMEIVIGTNIKSIKKHAFVNCVNLKPFTIPNTVTKIGDEAFAGCLKLNGYLAVPDTVIKIGFNVFSMFIYDAMDCISDAMDCDD